MLGILFSPVGRILGLVAALFLWTAYQRHDAAGTEHTRLTLQYEKATAAEVARQTGVRLAAEAAARARSVASVQRVKELEEIANELKSELSQNGTVCVIPDDLRKRLLRIN